MDDSDPDALGDLDPRALLREVKDTRAVEYAAAARLLDLAARWADLHPPESIEDTAVFFADRGGEIETPIAGPGCPAVAEFCVAEETIQPHPALTKEAAAWVDAQVAPFAAGIGHAQIQRMVTEAIRRLQLADPALPDTSDEAFGTNRRKVELVGDLTPYRSTVLVEAVLSVADALDLDRNLTHRAATLAALGSTEPLDTRRSQALGDLAREQTALDLAGLMGDDEKPDRLPAAREMVLHVHLDEDLTADSGLAPTVRVEERQRIQTLDQIKTWCRDSHTKVSVKPVIDLHQRLEAPGYTIPDRLREAAILRDGTCAFPGAHDQPARARATTPSPTTTTIRADSTNSPDRPRRTTSPRSAPATTARQLTGAGATTVVGPGECAWRDGHGNTYLRDRHGSREVEPAAPAEPARP